MTTIADNVATKISLELQVDQLSFRQNILSQDVLSIKRQIGDVMAENSGDEDYDPDADLALRDLEYEQEKYDTEKGTIESQLQTLRPIIEGLGKVIDAGAKELKPVVSI